MSLSRKKVIVRRLAGDFLPGYLPPSSFIRLMPNEAEPVRALDLLDLEGRSLPLPVEEIKYVCFVRDFNREDQESPERLTRFSFLSRPRSQGVWLRLTLTTEETLEGLAAQDLSLLDALVEDFGLFLTPPDERANTHRLYVPRSAIAGLEVLGVINSPVHKPARPARVVQPSLFAPDSPEEATVAMSVVQSTIQP